MLPKLFLLFSLVLSLAVGKSPLRPDLARPLLTTLTHVCSTLGTFSGFPRDGQRLEDSLARRRLKARKCDSSIAAFTAGRKAKRNGGAETVGVVKKRWNPTYDSIQK